jgi:hypothetical protein
VATFREIGGLVFFIGDVWLSSGRWVAKKGDGWLSSGRWVDKNNRYPTLIVSKKQLQYFHSFIQF